MQNVSLIEQVILIVEHYRCHLLTAMKHPFRYLLVLHIHLVPTLQKASMHLSLHPHVVASD